jgi:hypothetical protein
MLFVSTSAQAYHLVAATGYANSGTPHTGPGIERSSLFGAGSGYTAHARLEVERPHVYWGPSFLFWNNVTGAPTSSSRVTYFQIELGGRLSYRMTSTPSTYIGAGLGYSFSQGKYEQRFFDGYSYTFDGDFPTASVHLGAKTDASRNGVGLVAELSYHWGLDEPTGRLTIGPANAYLVQIGVFFDSMAKL